MHLPGIHFRGRPGPGKYGRRPWPPGTPTSAPRPLPLSIGTLPRCTTSPRCIHPSMLSGASGRRDPRLPRSYSDLLRENWLDQSANDLKHYDFNHLIPPPRKRMKDTEAYLSRAGLSKRQWYPPSSLKSNFGNLWYSKRTPD